MKNKETLEEAAVRLVKETTLYGSQEATIGSSARSYFETELRCVLLGAKWQQKQNLKDMQEYAEFCIICDRKEMPLLLVEDWYEHYKK